MAGGISDIPLKEEKVEDCIADPEMKGYLLKSSVKGNDGEN